MIKKTIKRLIKKTGYEIRKSGSTGFIESESDLDKYSMMFDYFPNWECKFDLNQLSFGGKNDYKTLRISFLNLAKLYEFITFKDKKILELGPLEGGNKIILHSKFPKSIFSLEARVDNYIKCCVIKNIYNLDSVKFDLGDARKISL